MSSSLITTTQPSASQVDSTFYPPWNDKRKVKLGYNTVRSKA